MAIILSKFSDDEELQFLINLEIILGHYSNLLTLTRHDQENTPQVVMDATVSMQKALEEAKTRAELNPDIVIPKYQWIEFKTNLSYLLEITISAYNEDSFYFEEEEDFLNHEHRLDLKFDYLWEVVKQFMGNH